jgi:hypothetical protein
MTNRYSLTHDVELHRSRLQAEAAGRPPRNRFHRRFRDIIPAMAGTMSRKPQLFPRPGVGSAWSSAGAAATHRAGA